MAEVVAKKALRKQIAKLLDLIPEEQVKKESAVVISKLCQSDWFKKANRISIFVSTKGEIITDGVIEHCLKSGKELFIPRFKRGAHQMDMLQLQSLKEFHELDTTLWGIRQPHPDASAPELFDLEDARLDLVILPGMAFTTCGRRLGHGKGFYDRFLHRYESVYGVRPKTVALALKSQIVDYVPVEEHDVNLNHVLHA